MRRRAEERLWRAYSRACVAVGWGPLVSILAAAWAFLLSRPVAEPFFWTPAGFVVGSAVALALAVAARLVRFARNAPQD